MNRFIPSSPIANDVHPHTTPVGYAYYQNAQGDFACAEASSTSLESAVFSVSSYAATRATPAPALSPQAPTQHLPAPLAETSPYHFFAALA